MPYTKFTYDRFHIHSYDDTKPDQRDAPSGSERRYLVFIAHGFFNMTAGKTTVRGVQRVGFGCNHEDTVEPKDFKKWVKALPKENYFWFDRTNAGGEVYDYSLRKELKDNSKSEHKGKGSDEFVDTSYIQKVYPENAVFDMAGIHNTFSSGRTVSLSTLFETLQSKMPGVYSDLLCGFCRELNF